MSQTGAPPFNPRDAVRKFASELQAWGLSRVTGDAYAGQTFRADFEGYGIAYTVAGRTKSELYDALEPRLNAGELELLDDGKLQEQLLTLVMRGGRIDHQAGDHDDFANAAAGALALACNKAFEPVIVVPIVVGHRRGEPGYESIWAAGEHYADKRSSGFSRRGF